MERMTLDSLSFVKVSSGYFYRGIDWDLDKVKELAYKYTIFPDWIIKEVPEKRIYLNDYYISKTPITFGMLKEYIDDCNSYQKLDLRLIKNIESKHHNIPAYPISLKLAQEFCKWMSQKYNESFELPTEEQWEKAAKGPYRREFVWGNHEIFSYSNTKENEIHLPVEVGKFNNHSFYGIDDLAGNVEEITSTKNSMYDGNPIKVMGNLDYQILRGGTCVHHLDLARCSRRHGKVPSLFTGFRVVKDSKDKPLEPNYTDTNINKGDYVFANIKHMDSENLYLDMIDKNGILPKTELTNLDVEIFKKFPDHKTEIIVHIVDIGDAYRCSRPKLEEFNNLFSKKIQEVKRV